MITIYGWFIRELDFLRSKANAIIWGLPNYYSSIKSQIYEFAEKGYNKEETVKSEVGF